MESIGFNKKWLAPCGWTRKEKGALIGGGVWLSMDSNRFYMESIGFSKKRLAPKSSEKGLATNRVQSFLNGNDWF